MESAGAFLALWLVYTLAACNLGIVVAFGAFWCVSVMVYVLDCIGQLRPALVDRDVLNDIGISGLVAFLGLRFAWLMWDIGALIVSRSVPIF